LLLQANMKQRTKEAIKENIHNIPNFLTLIRGIGAAILVYLVFGNYSKLTLAAVFLAFAVTDGIDGWIARRFNQQTKFGKYFDVVVDRIFMMSFVIFLIIKFGIIDGEILFKLLPLIMTREVIAAPVYVFIRKFDVRVNVKRIGKTTTGLQSLTVPAVLFSIPFAFILIILTSIVGIFSGISYAKDFSKPFKEKKEEI